MLGDNARAFPCVFVAFSLPLPPSSLELLKKSLPSTHQCEKGEGGGTQGFCLGDKKRRRVKSSLSPFSSLGRTDEIAREVGGGGGGWSVHYTHSSFPAFFSYFFLGGGDGSFVYVLWDWVTTSTPPCVS